MIRLGPWVITTPGELCRQVDAAADLTVRLRRQRNSERDAAVIAAQTRIIQANDRHITQLAHQIELLTQAASLAAVNEADQARRLP